MNATILSAIAVIVLVTLILVVLLLFVKAKITPKGTVKISINYYMVSGFKNGHYSSYCSHTA